MGSSTVDRFQLLEANQLELPHKCNVCGGFSGRKFVDFGAWVEFYGVVYICDQCFVGAAKVVGCVPAALYGSIEKKLDESSKVISQLIEENRRLRDAVDSLRIISNPIATSDSNSDLLTEFEGNTEPSRGSIAEGETGSTEQINERGSTLVRVDDNNSTA